MAIEARYDDLVAASAEMKRLFELLRRLEDTTAGVLIEGETGTGKELVARAIHRRSRLRAGPLVTLNCGAINRELVHSELFGHLRGSFTGAVENRAGAFVAADGGTLFLDEIGELPLDVQPVLLRALEERKVTAVGDHRERSVKVRVIAATNRNLAREVAQGTFREDLYYRLKVVTIRVPPLRERPEDIDVLVRRFGEQAGAREIPEAVLADFRRRPWPGNARELRNAVEGYLALGDAPPSVRREVHASRLEVDVDRPYQEQRRALLAEFTRAYVVELLARTQGNVAEASRRSGIERSYLNKLVRRLKARQPRD